MKVDYSKIAADKQQLRERLAERPVSEKLKMLDEMRVRDRAIKGSVVAEQNASAGQFSDPKKKR